jgi:serine/threonine protein kinase
MRREYLGMTEMSLFDVVEKYQVKPHDSASQSILLFAKSKETKEHVVVKISMVPSKEDNSLNIERQFYMFAQRFLSHNTPHILGGKAYMCPDSILKGLHQSHDENERALFHAWCNLQGHYVYPYLDPTEKQAYKHLGFQMFAKQHKQRVTELLRTKSTMLYVVTPKMKGTSLATFIDKHKYYEAPANFDLLLAFQIAQMLCCYQLVQAMHHDIHLGNMYIEYHEDPIEIPYTYPLPYMLKTRFKLTAFDYDHASSPFMNNKRLTRSFCKQIGECNAYVQNFDWYMFLMHFLHQIVKPSFRIIKQTEPFQLLSIVPPDMVRVAKKPVGNPEVGKDAFFGRACTCEQVQTNNHNKVFCTECKLNTKALTDLMSPLDFCFKVMSDFPSGEIL